MNKYEKAYRLESENGVSAFLNDYPRLRELRFYATDLSISDVLIDFEIAINKCLTIRQKEVIVLTYFKDIKQADVAERLNLSQQTVQEHAKKAIKNIATYHMLLKGKGE